MTEILETDPSARITRIPSPIASPGQCAICGKAEHPQGFAATDNFDFDFYGTVYFCADCVGDYARAFGFIGLMEYQHLLNRLTLQEEELEVLRRSVVNLETILDAYSITRPDSVVLPDPVTEPVSASEDASEPVVTGEGTPQLRVVSDVDSGEGEDSATNEPVSSEGRDDVRDSPSQLDDFLNDLGI